MTTNTSHGATIVAEKADPDSDAGGHASCDACAHRWDDHDDIEVRYCTATVASSLDRGCICEFSGHRPGGRVAGGVK